jgi:hypothetical protein
VRLRITPALELSEMHDSDRRGALSRSFVNGGGKTSHGAAQYSATSGILN